MSIMLAAAGCMAASNALRVDDRDIEAGSNNGPFGSGGTETATVIWRSDGTAEGTATSPTIGTTAQYDWLLAGNANQVQIKFTHTTGSAPTGGSALNTWLTLDSNRSLSLSVTNSVPDSGQVSDSSGGTYELQSIGGMSLGGGNWSLSATSDWSSI